MVCCYINENELQFHVNKSVHRLINKLKDTWCNFNDQIHYIGSFWFSIETGNQEMCDVMLYFLPASCNLVAIYLMTKTINHM